MSYCIAQDFEYVGNDYWRWSAWIDASEADLDRIKEVVWVLHPTFKRVRRVSKTRSDKFRLNTSGWGTFLLRAELMLANGRTTKLKHQLRLEYPSSSASTPATSSSMGARTVFLSYSSEDTRAAAKLRTEMTKEGLTVLDQSLLVPGEPWNDALLRMISQSDAVVALAGNEDIISPWVRTEIDAAIELSKPALLLTTGNAESANLPINVRRINIDLNRIDTILVVNSINQLIIVDDVDV